MSGGSSSDSVIRGLHGVLDDLEALYKDIHSHPELSMQEKRTAGLAAERLKAAGFEVTEGVGRTGVVGLLKNGDKATEDAVYFVCGEALQNTIKHAPAATVITLTITDRGDRLEFEVADDGPGFGAALPGTGFASMHQRIDALGGSLTIESMPGTGSQVHGSLPLGQ